MTSITSETSEAPYRLEPRRLVALYIGALAIALIPVAMVDVVPLADLPNHMARAYILNELGSNADLQKYYTTHWHILSFQSTDFMLPPLTSLFGIFAAARIYVALTFISLIGGTAALHRALFGKVGLWPLVSALFLYNFLFAWGFVSYLFATGLTLLLFAAWIATLPRRGLRRIAAFAVATLLLLLCHFFAFAAYAVLVASYEIARLWRRPENFGRKAFLLVEAAVPFLIPSALVLASLDRSAAAVSYYGTFADIARALVSPTIMYMDWSDFAVTYVIMATLWFCYRRKLLRFSRAMLLPVAVLVLIALAMPVSLTNVWGANLRTPCLLAFLLVAASDVELRSQRHATVLVIALAIALLIRVVPVTLVWRQYAADFDEFRVATASIEHGSRVLGVPLPSDYGQRRSPAIFPYAHVATLTVIERDVFLPQLFTLATPLDFTVDRRDLTQNLREVDKPIEWHPEKAAFASADPDTVRQVNALGQTGYWSDGYLSSVDWSKWPENFNYLVDFNFGASSNPVPALLTEVAHGSFFTIFRIHPPTEK